MSAENRSEDMDSSESENRSPSGTVDLTTKSGEVSRASSDSCKLVGIVFPKSTTLIPTKNIPVDDIAEEVFTRAHNLRDDCLLTILRKGTGTQAQALLELVKKTVDSSEWSDEIKAALCLGENRTLYGDNIVPVKRSYKTHYLGPI